MLSLVRVDLLMFARGFEPLFLLFYSVGNVLTAQIWRLKRDAKVELSNMCIHVILKSTRTPVFQK